MGFFELMPLVMVDISIAIQIGRLECFRPGLREMALEFRPTDQIISVTVQLTKSSPSVSMSGKCALKLFGSGKLSL
jgi:hypothetical protein